MAAAPSSGFSWPRPKQTSVAMPRPRQRKAPSRKQSLMRLGIGALLMALTSLWFLVLQKPSDRFYYESPAFPTWSWWWQPHEVNPLKRLHTLPRVTFNDIWTDATGTKVWAVGDQGVIVHSPDAGKTWEVQSKIEWGPPETPPQPPAQTGAQVSAKADPEVLARAARSIKRVMMSPDGRHGWALSQRHLLFTDNGGGLWRSVNREGFQSSELVDLTLFEDLSLSVLVAREASKAVLATTRDGGKTWQETAFTQIERPNKMAWSKDGSRGVISESTGLWNIKRSVSGAYTELPGLNTPDLSADFVQAIEVLGDGAMAWAGTERSGLLHSSDFGMNWRQIDLSAFVPSIKALTAYAPVGGNTPVSSTTGNAMPEGRMRGAVSAIRFSADGKTGFLMLNLLETYSTPSESGTSFARCTILRTADGGQSWKETEALPPGVPLTMAVSSDGQIVWLAGGDGVILHSADGGQSWSPDASNSSPTLFMAEFDDGGGGWAINSGTRHLGLRGPGLWRTTDSGRSWIDRSPPGLTDNPDPAYHAIPSEGKIWFTANRHLWHSGDAGRTWTKGPMNGLQDLLPSSLYFQPDGVTGWLGTDDGTVFRTLDGGKNWESVTAWQVGSVSKFEFLSDGVNGWLVSDLSVVRTLDGGKTWLQTSLKRSVHNDEIPWIPKDLAVLPGGVQLWACDNKGSVWKSADSGSTWSTQLNDSLNRPLHAIYISSDGIHGWTVGKSGHALRTLDAGTTWTKVDTGTTASLHSIWFAEDNLFGIVTDAYGTTLHSQDGGLTWKDARTYHRYPAPLYWAVMGVLGLTFIRRPRADNEEAAPSIADHYLSDRPLRTGDFDALGLNALARGLANYLDNRDTGAPLTLAINGAWGSGKSSFMNLVQEDLRRRGFRPVWFNAWHHQNEEHMLAAMLDSIRRQCVPPLWSFQGAAFRLRLLLLRLRGSEVKAAFFTALLALGLGVVWKHRDLVTVLLAHWREGQSKGGETTSLILQVLTGLGGLALVIKPLQLFVESMRAFGVDPAKAAAAMARDARISDLREQTSFRYRFAQEFGEVTQALQPDHRLVIFIDDLDRCQPDQMLLVLENVNYLVSAGECFMILGMEEDTVKDCLATQMEWRFKDQIDDSLEGEKRREARRLYVDKWLEKLVQVRVFMPNVSDKEALRLMTVEADADATSEAKPLTGLHAHLHLLQSLARPVWGVLRPYALLAVFITVAVLAFVGGSQVPSHLFAKPPPPAPVGTPAPAPSTPEKPPVAPTPGESAPKTTPVTAEAKPAGKVSPAELVVKPGATSNFRRWSSIPFWLALIAMAVLAWRLLIYLQTPKIRDSRTFKEAIDDWCVFLVQAGSTPRSLKRFINKVRFYAMLVRDEPEASAAPPASGEDHAEEEEADPAAAGKLEHLLVSFGAIEERFPSLPGPNWKTRLEVIPATAVSGKDRQRITTVLRKIDALQKAKRARAFFRMKKAWH